MKKYETDIAVVGGGTAGMAAAVAALQLGAKVIVIEKNKVCGGNGFFPMGMAAVESYLQKQLHIEADEDEMFRDVMNYSHWLSDPRLNRKLLHRSGETIKWLHDMGVEFADVVPHYPGQYPFVYHKVAPPETTGRVVMTVLNKEFGRLGGIALTGTPAKKILMRDGAVCGVLAEDADGDDVQVDTRKVIVCTGGFAGNEEMLRRISPDYDPDDYLYIHGIRPNGDGVRMMEEAGGLIDWNAAMAGGAPNITSKRSMVAMLVGSPCSIWLNTRGERFCDETVVYDLGLGVNALMMQPKKRGYIIVDKDIVDGILAEAAENPYGPPGMNSANWEKDCAVCIEKGELKIVDTMAEVAAFIGAEIETVEAEIGLYNHYCDTGRDALFSKNRKLMKPIRKPPYYVIKTGIDLLFTWGGIRCDHNFRVLDQSRKPIPGLYSAGNDGAGAIDGDTYHFGMSGHAFGYSIIGGRLAGEMLAQR